MRSAPHVPKTLKQMLTVISSGDSAQLKLGLRIIGARSKSLGAGSFREAFLVTYGKRKYVVKGRQVETLNKRPPKDSGILHAPTTRVRGWDVQHYYRPMRSGTRRESELYRIEGDYKAANSGWDTDGTLVAFDW
jgi:hypothetical protein